MIDQRPIPAGQHPDGMARQALVSPTKRHEFNGDPFGAVKVNSTLRKRILEELCGFVEQYLQKELGLKVRNDVKEDILGFYSFLDENPARGKKGATGNGLNLWLHLLVRQLRPAVIVESGVWVGRSLYTLKQASSLAEIHAFDISFDKLVARDPGIEYHEYDWSDSAVICSGVGFCYFDDHINNGRRIREAYERGFRHLVFDDCPSVSMVHLFRFPGLPSAIMLGNDSLREGDTLEWTWRDQPLRYRFEESHTYGAKDLIEFVKPLPSLHAWTGQTTANAAYVKLKEN